MKKDLAGMGEGISPLMIKTMTAPLSEHLLDTLLFTEILCLWCLSMSELIIPPPEVRNLKPKLSDPSGTCLPGRGRGRIFFFFNLFGCTGS